ncbi:hypothetical protein GG344DRAFT_76343 [Lentinula edodes]|nr:hypothetical protein GG344DRAFT_76343 [Lentinula edodes]
MTSSFPCPLLSSSAISVDDADLRIVYSSGWTTGGRIGFECEGTTHVASRSMNSTAIFTFEGIGVEVYGTVGTGESPTSTYQVDDLSNSQFEFVFPVLNLQNNYRVPFYRSPSLEPGNHTLTIMVLPEATTAGQFYLDYIIYNPIPTFTLPSPAATIIGSTYSTLSTCTAGTTPYPSSAAVPAIAGGVVGSIAGVVVGMILTFALLRKIRIRFWRKFTGIPAKYKH